MSKINILVACGSGVATSTLAANEIKDVCEEYGITNYNISKCSMVELMSSVEGADIVFTTNNYNGDLDIPHITVSGFITGIGGETLRKKVGDKLLELQKG